LRVAVRVSEVACKLLRVSLLEFVDLDMGFGWLDVVSGHDVMQTTARIKGRAAKRDAALGGRLESCLL
jgi:hypothetical protein